MGLWDPEKCPFPVFSLISRVRNLRSGPKFHRLSVSWPYSCVKSLKKFGHSGPEIWAFETPKNALFLCFHWYLEFGILDLAQKFWARSKIPNSRYQWKHRKRAFFGVSKAHISGPECPNFFKLFTQLYGQETDNRWNFGPDLRFRTRDINENTGKGHFSGSQRPISQDPNVQISSNFSHSCMARRRTIGEILGQI